MFTQAVRNRRYFRSIHISTSKDAPLSELETNRSALNGAALLRSMEGVPSSVISSHGKAMSALWSATKSWPATILLYLIARILPPCTPHFPMFYEAFTCSDENQGGHGLAIPAGGITANRVNDQLESLSKCTFINFYLVFLIKNPVFWLHLQMPGQMKWHVLISDDFYTTHKKRLHVSLAS